uniref:Uncharacterized protein n=1 Tax=Lactuca sativa TaxID=4236 RepID=A0A9R1WZ85_LACSA|nr:hypothetical protein LSAT_V11C800391300 [Lactuca sativa]
MGNIVFFVLIYPINFFHPFKNNQHYRLLPVLAGNIDLVGLKTLRGILRMYVSIDFHYNGFFLPNSLVYLDPVKTNVHDVDFGGFTYKEFL